MGEMEGASQEGRFTRRARAYACIVRFGKPRGRMIPKYEIVRDEKRIILKEINERADSIRVIPDRQDNKYILPESKLEEENINDDTS